MGEKSEVHQHDKMHLTFLTQRHRWMSITSNLPLTRLIYLTRAPHLPHHCTAHVTCSNTPLFAYPLALTVQSLTFTQPYLNSSLIKLSAN